MACLSGLNSQVTSYFFEEKNDSTLTLTDALTHTHTQTKFEDPLGGTTAAEDLMESFGFEGEVEEHTRRSTSPSGRYWAECW